jgi:glycerate dehydrogenase
VDVLSVEPPAETNPLLSARNCLVTPHIAWATREARARLMDLAIQNITAFLSGNPQNMIK